MDSSSTFVSYNRNNLQLHVAVCVFGCLHLLQNRALGGRRLSFAVPNVVTSVQMKRFSTGFFLNYSKLFITFCSRLPFNWKTFPIGYFIGMSIQFVVLSLIMRITSFLTCFLFGSSLVLIEFTKDFKQEIETMNEDWKTKRNQLELMEKLREIMWLDVHVKELSLNSF